MIIRSIIGTFDQCVKVIRDSNKMNGPRKGNHGYTDFTMDVATDMDQKLYPHYAERPCYTKSTPYKLTLMKD